MKLTIEPTDVFVTLSGVPCRIWEGADDEGTPVHCYVPLVAIRSEDVTPEVERRFAARLRETRAPSAEVRAIPARLVL